MNFGDIKLQINLKRISNLKATKYLINLASNEYFKSVNKKELKKDF